MGRVNPHQLLAWLDGHPGQLPQERKNAKASEDQLASKLARYLRHLRGQDDAGKLPLDLKTKLEQVCLTPTQKLLVG